MLFSPAAPAERKAAGLRELDEKENRVAFRLTGIGYDCTRRGGVEAPRIVRTGDGVLTGTRPEGLSEWYRSGKDGIEHGFTLVSPPARVAGDSTPLELALEVESDLRLVAESADSIVFENAAGGEIWKYRHLAVFDRDGGRVPAWMELRRGLAAENPEILLCVADSGARYPLTVDPTFVSAEVASFPGATSDGSGSSTPEFMGTLGDTVLFFANDGYLGDTLWRTDRTTGETTMVMDINPGGGGCFPTRMVSYKGAVWFGAFDDTHKYQLWRSDGTAGGTAILHDFTATGVTKVDNAALAGDWLLFNVLTNAGTEMWRTDGTSQGTVKVIAAGDPRDCNLREALSFGGALLYSSSGLGGQLWRTDGTAEGTFMLTGTAGWPRQMTASGDFVFFMPQGTGEVWRTDGTVAGTVKIAAASENLIGPPVSMGGLCYLGKILSSGATSLWRSDGGPFVQVRHVATNLAGSIKMLGSAGSLVYFMYANATEVAVWKSDGTQAGTSKVLALGSPDFVRISDPMAAGDHLFFSGTTEAGGNELWKTDGTAAGTGMVRDIRAGSGNGYAMPRLASGNLLYFIASEAATGSELWRTDGTEAGTALVRDIYPDRRDNGPANMTVVGDRLFFSAYAPGMGRELWRTDGTSANTVLVKDVVPGPGNGFGDLGREQWIAAEGLLFAMPWPAGARSLWRSDGTADGTFLLKSPITGPPPSGIQTHVVAAWKNMLFFREGTSQTELWRSDGTVEGTIRLASGGDGITPFGDRVLFVGTDANGVGSLWRTDGTAEGTSKVLPTRLEVGSPGQNPFRILNGRIYFSATDGVRGTELWRSDGTAAGTSMVADLTAGAGSSFLGVRGTAGGRVFFSKGTNGGGEEIWSTDGTAAGTSKLGAHSAPTFPLMPQTGPQGGIFYYTPPGAANYEIWGSNGTAAGTRMLKSFGPKASLVGASGMRVVNGRLLFSITTSALGSTVWSSDGTPEGTQPLLDLYPGVERAAPTIIGTARGYGFIAATDPVHGRELWVTDGSVAGTRLVEDLNPGLNSSTPFWAGEVNGRVLAGYSVYPSPGAPGFREIIITPVPVLQATGAEVLANRSVRLLGDLNPDGASGHAHFEYGETEAYGQTTADQLKDTTGAMSAVVEGLKSGAVYHFRPVFVTPGGTFYGADRTFTMPALRLFASDGGGGGELPEILNGQPHPVTLPETPEGTASRLTLVIRNDSAEPVALESLSLPPGYSLPDNPLPLTLPPGGGAEVKLALLSSAPGVFTGQASLETGTGAFVFPVTTTVYHVNKPPVMDAVPLITTPEDTAVSGQLSAVSVENLPLIYLWLSNPDPAAGSLVFSPTGSFTFTPAENYSGPASFMVTAYDGILQSLPVIVSIDVTPVNDPPTLTSLARVTLVEGLPAPAISLSVADPDDPAASLRLSFSVSPPDSLILPPSTVSVSGEGGQRTLTLHAPGGTGGGTATLMLTLSDGRESVSTPVSVTVLRNLVTIQKSPVTGMDLQFTGVPGLDYRIQRSTDLQTWTSVNGPVKADASGAILWNDGAPPPQKAFYRLLAPGP